jgi:hypothetical protein
MENIQEANRNISDMVDKTAQCICVLYNTDIEQRRFKSGICLVTNRGSISPNHDEPEGQVTGFKNT